MVSCGRHTAITNADRCASSRLIRQQICDNFCSTFGRWRVNSTICIFDREAQVSKWFNEDAMQGKKKSKHWINQLKTLSSTFQRTRLLPLYGMPCIIKAPQLLFEFQISFFHGSCNSLKNQVFIIRSVSERGRERSGKRVRLFKSRTLRKVRHSSAQLKLWRFLFRAKVENLKV